MTLDRATAPAAPAGDLRRRLNRWLSPDHAVGQSLMALRMRAQLAAWRPSGPDERALKATVARLAPAFTMVDLPRLRQLAALAALVARDRVPGAVVECGTWRGGGLALVDWVLREAGDPRELWGFDSFAGLPAPGSRDGRHEREGFFEGWCAASEADVRRAMAAAGGSASRLHLVPGWLADTLPVTDPGPVALLNLDVDWYDSVTTALAALYDRVAAGGVVNVDDYGRWPGCDAAVHDFFEARGLPLARLQRTGRHGAWFRKP